MRFACGFIQTFVTLFSVGWWRFFCLFGCFIFFFFTPPLGCCTARMSDLLSRQVCQPGESFTIKWRKADASLRKSPGVRHTRSFTPEQRLSSRNSPPPPPPPPPSSSSFFFFSCFFFSSSCFLFFWWCCFCCCLFWLFSKLNPGSRRSLQTSLRSLLW